MRHLKILLVFLCSFSLALAWTKSGTTYTTSGSLSDVNSAITDASTNDTVNIPSGSFTWGTAGTSVTINKAISLTGAGEGSTTIALAADGPYYASGAITITAAANVSGFTITGIINTAGGPSTTPFSISSTGWRVHHITFNGPVAPGYFAYCSAAYGLFDHITVNAAHGSCQTFMIRGGSTVWAGANTMGTSSAVYIEDSTINGDCYVDEGDGSAQVVIRFCLITGQSQIDQHQIETSTDSVGTFHGGRQLENYDNRWSNTTSRYFPSGAMDIKSGTGVIFDDTADTTPYLLVEAYGAQGTFWNSTFTTPVSSGGTKYITPAQIPTRDYIGVGPTDTQGSEPMYFVHNMMNTAGADTGQSTNINWPVSVLEGNVAAGAITQYGSTFLAADIVQIDSSYFDTATGTFDGSTGVGRGTKAAMNAINMTGKTKKVGWWVTDEGSWRAGYAGTSGQLYQWNGSSWVLYYTPYTYPHPLRSATSFPATPTNYRKPRTLAGGF